MTEQINVQRRLLVSSAALGALAAQAGLLWPAQARAATLSSTSGASFGPLKHVDAGVLNIAYVEMGPADGPPVLLLHGWPYDIHSFVEVAPILANAGFRVLVPYVRGYGETRFLSADTPRNGQPAAVAVDQLDFLDALGIG